MSSDAVATATRELVSLGADAFCSPATDELVVEIGREHPARMLYTRSTARAIARHELPGLDPDVVASEVFSNFIWTHFVCKPLMTAAPETTAAFVADHFDLSAIVTSLKATGPSILSCFHYTAYPLVALGLAISAAAPLISKARVDVLDQADADTSNHVVHTSNRSAAIRLTRALRQGRSVWILLDVVLPTVRAVRAEFLGHKMNVGAGLGKIAQLSGRPCLPVFWGLWHGRTCVKTAPPVFPTEEAEGGMIQAFVSSQAAFISRQPNQWLEWYSVLDDAQRLRAEIKRGNEAIWERVRDALT